MWKMSTRDALKANWISINCKIIAFDWCIAMLVKSCQWNEALSPIFFFPLLWKEKKKKDRTVELKWNHLVEFDHLEFSCLFNICCSSIWILFNKSPKDYVFNFWTWNDYYKSWHCWEKYSVYKTRKSANNICLAC